MKREFQRIYKLRVRPYRVFYGIRQQERRVETAGEWPGNRLWLRRKTRFLLWVSAGIVEASVEGLRSIRGIGLAKAAQLKACVEVAPRYLVYYARWYEEGSAVRGTMMKSYENKHSIYAI